MNNYNEMSEEEKDFIRAKGEEEFFKMLKNGDDISTFLFFPYDLLTDKVKSYLNEFLMLEAYKKIEKDPDNFEKNFILYEDVLIKIKVDDKEKKIELLEKMIEYFIEKELYENCIKVKKILEKLKK